MSGFFDSLRQSYPIADGSGVPLAAIVPRPAGDRVAFARFDPTTGVHLQLADLATGVATSSDHVIGNGYFTLGLAASPSGDRKESA